MSASRRVANAIMAGIVISFAGAMCSAWGQAPQHVWSQRFGDNYPQQVWSVAVDDSGNVLVTGDFYGTVDFGGGPLTAGLSADIFVAKFDAAGNHAWSQRFGDDGYQVGNSVAVDDSGNVIVTGVFSGTVDFGGGTLTNTGFNDIYVVKFDGDGNHLWSQRFGNENEQYGESVAADDSGNVYLTGGIFGAVDFGGGPLTSAGSHDIFVAKFNGAGNHIWSERFGGVDSDGGTGVTVDGLGNVLVTGGFQDNVDFGGGQLTSAGFYDIYVAKFDGAGDHVWSQRFGDDGYQAGNRVAVDDSGNVIVTGVFWGTVDFGGGPLTATSGGDIFVAKFDGGSNHLWSQGFGAHGESVAVDGSGNVIVTGVFSGTVDFGGGTLTSAGSSDIFVAKFDGAGNHVWSQRFGDASWQEGNCVAVDVLGNVVVAGDFDGTVDFGGGPLTAMTGEPPDIFVAKFGSGPTSITDTVIPNMFALRQNMPNPFNPTTVIQYDVPETGGHVALLIYDVAGRLVRTLVDGQQAAGNKRVTWNGDDDRASRVASGVYFYRMTAPGFEMTKKMVLLK